MSDTFYIVQQNSSTPWRTCCEVAIIFSALFVKVSKSGKITVKNSGTAFVKASVTLLNEKKKTVALAEKECTNLSREGIILKTDTIGVEMGDDIIWT